MNEDLISKEKAYKVLTEYYHHKTEMQHKALRVALDMVPSVDVPDTNVGDMISRQAAIDAIESAFDRETILDRFVRKIAISVVRLLPSAQPELEKGKWIYPTDIKGYGRCPHCKALWDYSLISNPFFKFCPRCGNGENELTELKGEEDENNNQI